MEKKAPGPNPGLIWCNSKVTKPEELSRDSFCSWYSSVHIPDVLQTGTVREAFRYLAIDADEELFHMTLYYVDDVEGLYEKVKTVRHHHEDIPGSHDMFDYGFFDTRFYKSVQLFEPESVERSQPDFLLSSEMLPADEQDFENWYRQEHLVDGSKIAGWRRTERYELFNALRTDDAPKYLTLLFLDGSTIPMKDLENAAASEWTQKIVSGMRKFRTGMFQKSTHHVADGTLTATARSSSL